MPVLLTEKDIALRCRTLAGRGLRTRGFGSVDCTCSSEQDDGGEDGKNAFHETPRLLADDQAGSVKPRISIKHLQKNDNKRK
jgi:hypothetical protein